MRKMFLLFKTVLVVFYCNAQIDSISTRVFLVGDAGGLIGASNPVVAWLSKNVDWNDQRNCIIYLGDNIYPQGMPVEGERTYAQAKRIIDYQISLVKGKKAKAFFVLGNHDWKNGKNGGWEQAVNEVNYINSLELPNVTAQPLDGCPGPVEAELNDKVVIALIDSQWWLHLHEKPGPESHCDFKTQDEVVTGLREMAATHPNQLLIVAMHHPMYSYGVHGGNYTLRHHIFPFTEAIRWLYIPLPVIGSIYPITRGIFGNIQDVHHPLYRTMIRQIEGVLKDHPDAIQVAGHDHALQMLMKDSITYIISGSGLGVSRVKKGKWTLFADAEVGFAMLEVRKSGKVEAKFYNLNSASVDNPIFVKQIKNIDTLSKKAIMDSIKALPDSIMVVANPSFKASGLKEFFFGKNYRKEWTDSIRVQVLDIGKEKGGLKPTTRGGGKQTKTLRLKDNNGNEYALRSIIKFPNAALPPDLRETIAEDIVRDGVSASYPFAALSIPPLAHAANVPFVRGKLVFVPDDPRLERFRIDFKNTLCMLEEREPPNVGKTYNTEELALRLLKDHDDHIDQKIVLRARLLDMFVMDLDRHEDQWRWATYDTGKGKLYYPIPRDHDQVFFINNGLFPTLAARPWLVPQIQGFKSKALNIKTFNFAARNFDRAFLSELDEKGWRSAVDTFLTIMTDSVMERSLKLQPREIQKYSAEKIVSIMKKRRQYFMDDMIKYYKFISKIVNVVGSNQKELFTITRNNGGTVLIQVNAIRKAGVSSLMYQRLFEPDVTKEIRVYGMGDDDRFVFKGDDHSRIKIRVIGGPGEDEFDDSTTSGGKTIVYDVNYEKNKFTGNNNFRKKITADPTNNKYERLYYKYNIIHPDLSFGYNIDDGLYLGARLRYTGQGFRKEPYATFHDLHVIHSLKTKAFNIRYKGEFIKAVKNADFVLIADIKAPNNTTNFFGLGNNTVLDKSGPEKVRFYRSTYNVSDIAALLRHRLQSWMDISYGPAFEFYSIHRNDNRNRILYHPTVTGLDSATLYKRKSYLGGQFGLTIDTRNHIWVPTRGLYLQAGIKSLFGLNNVRKNLTQLKYDMAIYVSLVEQTKIVFATRFGVGHNIGHFEFFQAQYLSGIENLRGYRKYRFAGKTLLFSNNDLRIKISDFTTYLLPGSLGIHMFFDIGRVWINNEKSNTWHNGYGAGIWISPLRRVVFAFSVAHSKEETLPLVTVGFQF